MSDQTLPSASGDEFWELSLYVAGDSPKSTAALANLTRLCEEHLRGRYAIEVIDLAVHPELAAEAQIVAIPTVVRTQPDPIRTLIGNFSDTERVLIGLQLRPAVPSEGTK